MLLKVANCPALLSSAAASNRREAVFHSTGLINDPRSEAKGRKREEGTHEPLGALVKTLLSLDACGASVVVFFLSPLFFSCTRDTSPMPLDLFMHLSDGLCYDDECLTCECRNVGVPTPSVIEGSGGFRILLMVFVWSSWYLIYLKYVLQNSFSK